MKTKTVKVGYEDMTARDTEFIDEVIADALTSMGIEVTSFNWHIEIEISDEEV
jgi:hypothetical protein